MPDPTPGLLARLVAQPCPPPFAVLRREEGPGVEVFTGSVVDVPTLAEIPDSPASGPHLLALVPYRQVVERGFTCHNDGVPLRCLVIEERKVLPVDEALDLLPPEPVDVTGGAFDVDDDAYAATVAAVVSDEIGRGEGANFVLRRDFLARTATAAPQAGLRLFRRLLAAEPGAYWTFVVSAGEHTLVGATPERHVSSRGGEVLMNPISGTYRQHALRGPAFASVQFHLESLLSPDGTDVLAGLTRALVSGAATSSEDRGRVA